MYLACSSQFFTFSIWTIAILIVATIFLAGIYLVLDRIIVLVQLSKKSSIKKILEERRKKKQRRRDEYAKIKRNIQGGYRSDK